MDKIQYLLPHHLSHRVAEFAAFGEAATGMAMKALAHEVVRQAQHNAQTGHHQPHGDHIPGTGPGPNTASKRLLNNISHSGVKLTGFGNWKVMVGVGQEAYYAKFAETYGYANGAKYPFLIPAINQVKERIAPAVWGSAFAEFKIATGL